MRFAVRLGRVSLDVSPAVEGRAAARTPEIASGQAFLSGESQSRPTPISLPMTLPGALASISPAPRQPELMQRRLRPRIRYGRSWPRARGRPMSSFTSESRLAHTLLLSGGVVLRSIGDAMRYLDTRPPGPDRNALMAMLQEAHWYGDEVEPVTRRLPSFLERAGAVRVAAQQSTLL